jgi:hypothetical protein
MIKVICIFVNESHRLPLTLNHFYFAEDTEAFSINFLPFATYFIYNEDKTHYYGIYEKEHFMTMEQLAEWREQQMKIVLDE